MLHMTTCVTTSGHGIDDVHQLLPRKAEMNTLVSEFMLTFSKVLDQS